MPVEDKQQPKHAKQQQHHQRHSTPVEDEEVTPSNGAKEEKTIPTTKYVLINSKLMYVLLEPVCTYMASVNIFVATIQDGSSIWDEATDHIG